MKALFFTVLFPFVSVGLCDPVFADTAAPPKHSDVLQMTFIDATHGWAVERTAVEKLVLLHTMDAGKSWADVTPQGKFPAALQDALSSSKENDIIEDIFLDDFFTIYALDEKRVWFAIDVGEGDKAQALIERSVDGGAHWDECTISLSRTYPFGFQFLDPLHGFLLGSSDPGLGSMVKKLFATDDGGATWKEMTSPDGFGAYYTTGFGFSSRLDGWYTATYHGAPDVPVICTHDGGKTWKVQQLDLPPDFKLGYGDADEPHFFGDDKKGGLMVVHYVQHEPKENDIDAIYATHDGGSHWALAGKSPVASRSAEKNCGYAFWNEKSGVVMTDTQLFTTTDGGASWAKGTTSGLPQGTDIFVDNLQFIDEKNGWVLVTSNAQIDYQYGRIFKTADGGKTWTEVSITK